MIRALLPFIALVSAACVPHPVPDQTPVHGAGKCSVEGLKDLIGAARSPEVEATAKRRSGAGVIRWIAPGQMVTMDYREDRLDLRIGPDGRITAISCG